MVVTNDYREVIQSDSVEVVVDATGVPEVGANISLEALNSKKHLVLLNVEVDITIGLVMHKLFTNAGLVYSGSAGDEPAATLELYEFAKQWGLKYWLLEKVRTTHSSQKQTQIRVKLKQIVNI